MPNNQLVDQMLRLTPNATPTERLVLKLAAALMKQIDPEYSVFDDPDERIKVPREEWDWLPGRKLSGIPLKVGDPRIHRLCDCSFSSNRFL